MKTHLAGARTYEVRQGWGGSGGVRIKKGRIKKGVPKFGTPFLTKS